MRAMSSPDRHPLIVAASQGLPGSTARQRVPIVTEATAHALVSLISRDRLAGWIGRLDAAVLEVFGREQSYRRQALTAVPDLVGRGAARYLGALTRNSARRRPLNRSKS